MLPPHKFGTHDVVMKPNKSDLGSPPLGKGGVYRIKDTSITVAFEDIPEKGMNGPLRLEKVANEETLIQLSKGIQTGPAAYLIPVLFGERSTVLKKEIKFTPVNSNLDHSQVLFQRLYYPRSSFCCMNLLKLGRLLPWLKLFCKKSSVDKKILACAASNIAVDNIVERLVPHRVKLVRVGHPAHLLPQVLDTALDAQ